MSVSKVHKLPARMKALVAIAVLLDGFEATNYLEGSGESSGELRAAAKELASLAPELRMPLVGTLLRVALKEIER